MTTTGPPDFWRGDARVAELEAEVERLRGERDHWRANHDTQLARKRKARGILSEVIRQQRGRADWIYDGELHCHIPCCTVQTRGEKPWERCGNGPLEGEQIATGDCGEHA